MNGGIAKAAGPVDLSALTDGDGAHCPLHNEWALRNQLSGFCPGYRKEEHETELV